MRSDRGYVGIHEDTNGGITPTGTVIRDAWVFGIIPQAETCAGWGAQQIQKLYDQVFAAWEPYGHLVSGLPAELRERHARIYDEAVRQARDKGWSPDMEDDG